MLPPFLRIILRFGFGLPSRQLGSDQSNTAWLMSWWPSCPSMLSGKQGDSNGPRSCRCVRPAYGKEEPTIMPFKTAAEAEKFIENVAKGLAGLHASSL